MGETNTIHLKVEEDVPAELEAFVRLSHFALFDQAREWFDGCLRDHLAEFPVALEYADMLLRQGSYREVEVLDLHSPDTAGLPEHNDIDRLWGLLEQLAIMHLQGPTSDALEDAMACFDYLRYRRVGGDARPSALVIHMLEVYLQIVVGAHGTSMWPEGKELYTNPPWCQSDLPAWRGFGAWYADLRECNHFWEAQRILTILLPVLPFKDAIDMFMKPDQFGLVVENIDQGSFDETLVLSDLMSANNICNYVLEYSEGLLSHELPREHLFELAGAYLESSRSLAVILSCLSKTDKNEELPPVLQVEMLEKRLGQLKEGPLSTQIHSDELQPRMPTFTKASKITAATSQVDYTQGTHESRAPEPLRTLHPDQANPAWLHALQQSLASPTAAAPTRYTCASENVIPGNLGHTGPIALQVGLAPVIPRWARSQTVNFAALANGYPRSELALLAANALRDAAEEWNQLDLGVKFQWVEKIQDASFILCYGGDRGEALAQAFFPTEKQLSTLDVYSASFRPGTVQYLKNIFLHELGHVLGFRHAFAPNFDVDEETIEFGPRSPTSVMGYEFPPQIQATDRESAVAFYSFPGPSLRVKDSQVSIRDYSAR
ncbi:hypothetical protein N7532_002203 [Penicillium argentinense]|uniref:Zincin n=1 Tax=Penicillium argentinense TaxID=1131581 RepID=A0A9W9KL94_9EURO|nr:uncharacterized protein N7532_002203 [Penicillium argentinense]KAJ5109558.1 hypothetical protein N7532_002203 [Penicillium argentinense]